MGSNTYTAGNRGKLKLPSRIKNHVTQQKHHLNVLIDVFYSFFVSEIIYADSAGVRYVQYFISR